MIGDTACACRAVHVGECPPVIFGCGCTADMATGLPIGTCRRHDQRTREVKASAALMQMANELDETGNLCFEGQRDHLKAAAKYAVKAAKALIGTETD